MLDAILEVERALATVQQTLDRLNERGHSDEAFPIAKALYSASIRASWPGNLMPLAVALDDLHKKANLKLDALERAEIEQAAKVLRSLCG